MACVDSVSRSPLDSSNALNPQKAPNFAAELQAAQVKVSQSQTADITIVTAEGDTVTLSSSKSAELSFTTYDAQGQIGGTAGAFSGMSAELHRSSAFSISVEGDLNKEELKDIRRAIRTIQKATHDVFIGHEEKAASRTAKLAKLDQIASIDADMEFNQEVSVTRVSAQSDAVAPSETTETQPSIPPPDSQPVTAGETEPAAPVQSSIPAESSSTVTGTNVTTSSHLSVLIHTQAGAPVPSSSDSSMSGLWWLPSSDLWNILHPKSDPLKVSEQPATESTAPVAA